MHGFCDRDEAPSVLVITGTPGCGKSALMARFTEEALRHHPDQLILGHFVRASPSSTSLRQMLRRLCTLLNRATGATEDSPEDIKELLKLFFFWQASQEVEDERAQGRTTVAQRQGATAKELRVARTDVVTGMFFSNLVMYFIILTTAATLHAHGQTHIETAREAAEALRPLAGRGAYLLFTLGLIGTGMLAVPVLAGSAAYAVAESKEWRGTLEDRPGVSRKFYTVVAVSMVLGLVSGVVGFNAVKMLFYSAVLNGVLAPPLIVLVVLLTSKPEVMGTRVSSRPLRYLGWATAAIMTAAAVGMFATM
jgi:Mn2+/Fe2+ NRAMP family transporter